MWLLPQRSVTLGLTSLAVLVIAGHHGSERPRDSAALTTRLAESYGALPLQFELNRGQTDSSVRFLARGAGYNLFLTDHEAVFALRSSRAGAQSQVVRLAFEDGNDAPDVEGVDQQSGGSHYLIGRDPAQWVPHVPRFAKVRYRQVYRGIDLLYYGNQRQLEYDLVVAPGADPQQARLSITGVERLRLNDAGDLLLVLPDGEIVQHRPVAYQQAADTRTIVDARYRLLDDATVGYEIGAYDTSRELIIDPVLAYSTYLGGTSTELMEEIAVDGSGNAYVTGATASANFPTTAGTIQPNFGGGTDGPTDAFVTKLNAAGTALLYSTYLGGSGNDRAFGIAVDAAGNAYVTGSTTSPNFPTTAGVFQTGYGGSVDAFVAKLNPQGAALVFATYFGSSQGEFGVAVAVDGAGSVYIGGETGSTQFPTTSGAFQTTLGGNTDAFVTKLNATGSALVYSTYVGGSETEMTSGIAIDSSGSAYVTGSTFSANFPTTAGVFQGSLTPGGFSDAFLAKLNAAGSALSYGTYLGGSENESVGGIAVSASGEAYVAGRTRSTNFPTTSGAFQITLGGQDDGFLTRLNAAATNALYSTLLGGNDNEDVGGIAIDAAGNAYVTGSTSSTNFPTLDPLFATNTGLSDAFITSIAATGASLVYSTYYGGSSSDAGRAIAVDGSTSAYVAGTTFSTNFPTTSGASQNALAGANDAFVIRFGGVPTAANDSYSTSIDTVLTVSAPGVLANDSTNGGGPLSATLVSNVTSGTLVLNANGSFSYTPASGFTGSVSFTYRASNSAGAGTTATVTITVAQPTILRPPTNLRLVAIAGNTLTIGFDPPTNSITPTGYVLEGGVLPGQVLASIAIPGTATTFTFTAPTGVFFIRVHSVAGSGRSVASNEIQIFVNVPQPPSAPSNLLSLVNGTSIALAWHNGLVGGPPTRLRLDVTGSITASLALPVTDSFAFAGVPPGTYTVSLRAENASGTSASSNPVTFTVPSPCTGAPGMPTGFSATKSGSVISLTWNLPPSGPAPTGYTVVVAGSFVGSIPVTARSISGAVGPGSYTLSVVATNACGSSPATPPQTVTIP